MWRAALKNLWAHKMRTGLLSFAVLAGVSMIVAAFVFTDTIGVAFENLFSEAFSATDIQVRRHIDEELNFGFGERLPGDLVDQLRSVDGVAGAWGSVAGLAQLIGPDGEPFQSTGAPTFVTSWTGGPSSFTLRAGDPPAGPNDVVIDVGTANLHDLEVGDSIDVAVGGPKQSFTIVGLLGFGEADNLLGSAWAVFDLDTAQALLDAEGLVDAIELNIEPGADLDSVIAAVNAQLPEGIEAVSSQTVAEEQSDQIKQGLGFLNTFLTAFGAIALFVGTFVIYNAFRIVVAHRTRELGLLRAIGASRDQVTRSVLLESAVTGLFASILGIGGGIVLALLLEFGLEAAFGGDLPTAGVQLQLRTAVIALVAGTTVTVLSAIIPAIRASRISPMAAIRDLEPTSTRRSITRMLTLGVPFLVLGIAAMAAGLTGNTGGQSEILFVGVGAAVVFVGVYILSPLIARPVARVLGSPLGLISPSTGKLARANAMRSPRRTAATAGALMIGLSLVTAVAMLAASVRDTATSTIEDVFAVDLILQPAGFGVMGGFSPEVAERVEALGEVADATPIQNGPARVRGATTFITGIDPDEIGAFVQLETVAGDIRDLNQPETIATTESLAEAEDLEIGDPIDIGFTRTGESAFTLVAIVSGGGNATGSWFISSDTYAANYLDALDSSVYVDLAPGVTLAEGTSAIESALQDYPGIDVIDQEELRSQIESQINQLVFLIFGLLAMSVFIALIGITLTLLLSVYERTREIGLLRAVGMSRQQVRNMIGMESMIIAVFGALLGAAVGIGFGWALATALSGEGLILSIPWSWLIAGFIGAAIAGVVAAAFPAFRASSLDVLEAIAYE